MKRSTLLYIPTVLMMLLTSCDLSTYSLTIENYPNKTNYYVNESFSLEGFKITDERQNIEITDYISSIEEGYTFTNEDVGKNVVTISKENYQSVTFDINVIKIEDLEIYSYPKTSYTVGESFSINGLIVKAKGKTILDYEISLANNTVLTTPGEIDVVVSKHGYNPASFVVTVSESHSLVVSSLPSKVNYETGETFTSEGLVIKDEKGALIDNYKLSIEEGETLKYAGDITVEVTKENYTKTSFDIKVNEAEVVLPKENTSINIYYINDTHGAFIRNDEEKEAGMSYISAYIKDQKADDENSLIISGGDMFQGGYESNETRGKIMIEAMNEIGFEAMTIGNHEFDWGEEAFTTYNEVADFPLLACNIFYSSDNITRPTWAEPYVVLEKGNLKIGIIGAVKEGIGSSITGSISSNFYFPQANEYIKEYSTYLRQSKGCDLIIASFHDGGFSGYTGSPTQYEDLTEKDYFTKRTYVDAMLFAHDHYRKSGFYNAIPYIEAGCNGEYIGQLEFKMKYNENKYILDKVTVGVTNAYDNATKSDPKIDAIAQKDEYKDIIARADEVLYTFKSSYSSDNFTYVVCLAMYWYVNNHLSEFDNTKVYFASHNTGGVRADVSSGKFTRRDLVKVFPFDNLLSIQTCTSKHISAMENNSYYETYKDPNIVYTNGYTKAISITYITEYKNASNYQSSYKNYDKTAKDALIEYLVSGVNPNL